MRTSLIHERDGQKTYIAVLDTGDEVMGCLVELSRRVSLTAAQITGIGAFEKATLNYLDWEEKHPICKSL